MNFSWAMDLDPKGANNQIKEAIDKRYLPDDEEPITQEEQISECYPYESGLYFQFILQINIFAKKPANVNE